MPLKVTQMDSDNNVTTKGAGEAKDEPEWLKVAGQWWIKKTRQERRYEATQQEERQMENTGELSGITLGGVGRTT